MATHTRWPTRVFALVFIVLFAGGIIAVPVIYFTQEKNNQTDSTASTTTNIDSQTGETKPVEGKLEGTQLADFSPTTSPVTSLQIIDTKPGDGREVKAGDTVTVDYTGALVANGKIFQSSLDTGQPVTFPLGQVIKGWTDGVPGMKIGGTRRLVIPAAQAYGSQSTGGIPANSDLVFDITLQSIGE